MDAIRFMANSLMVQGMHVTRRLFSMGFAAQLAEMSFPISAKATRGSRMQPTLSAILRDAAEVAFNDSRARGLPGMCFAAHGPGVNIAKAFGVADVATKRPMHLDMHMRLGSIQKLMVCTALLRIVDRQGLALDDVVSRWRSDIPFGNQMTLRSLCNHTSGLSEPLRSKRFRDQINAAPEAAVTREAILKASLQGAQAPSVDRFRYSNANTVLLAEILERESGLPLDRVLQRELFDPLGVSGISIPNSELLPEPSPSGYRYGAKAGAIEYGSVFFDATRHSASWAGAAGNINGDVRALLKLGDALLTSRFLTANSRSEQRQYLPVSQGFQYGLGLAKYDSLIGHAGDVPGFSSAILHHPKRRLSLAVLANLSNFKDKSSPALYIARSIEQNMDAILDKD